MKVEFIGSQYIDYDNKKTGKHVSGHKLFYKFKDDRVVGEATDSVYIPASSSLPVPVSFPSPGEIYFSRYGSVDIINLL